MARKKWGKISFHVIQVNEGHTFKKKPEKTCPIHLQYTTKSRQTKEHVD